MAYEFNLSTGAVTISSCFKILKIFHQLKPNRSSDNTKNPTVTSHSWGRKVGVNYNGYYYFRTKGDGTGGVSFNAITSPPAFLNNLYAKSALTCLFIICNTILLRSCFG